MEKILTIIKREYLTRVRKRSFIIMTILGPLLMAGLMIVPVFISQLSDGTYKVAIVDDTRIFYQQFKDANNIEFTDLNIDIDSAIEIMKSSENVDAILHIPTTSFQAPSTLRLFSDKTINFNAKMYVEGILKHEFEKLKMANKGIDPEVLRSTETKISIKAIKLTDKGEHQSDYPEVSMFLGIFSGVLIYFFVFLFGAQVMRGVMEEKGSRIVEIIVSSVKPFQLMMGKITGIAMVGLTQFLIWVILTLTLVGVFSVFMPSPGEIAAGAASYSQQNPVPSGLNNALQQPGVATDLMNAINSINFGVMLGTFLFYFLGGYLLYAAMFAAIGAAVDNEADTQQFMLPITVPMIFSLIMAQMIINNPNGPVAFWMSVIPFTSPIIMMVRIPFGVPFFDVVLSMILLVAGFIAATWIASKIYRSGILMYGKKITYKDLWKWIRRY